MEVDNKHTTEEVFDFFRNVLNILPTREQKQYIKLIHENDRSFYYKKYRQIGETVAINGYLLWLLYMARVSQKSITIIMAGKSIYNMSHNMDCLREILGNSAISLKYKMKASTITFDDGSRILYVGGDPRSLFGYELDHLYVNGIMDNIERLKVNEKIMRTMEP